MSVLPGEAQVVYDLDSMIRTYIESKEAGRKDAAKLFAQRLTHDRDAPGPVLHRYAKRLIVGLDHCSNRSLYDSDSVGLLLASVGFTAISSGDVRSGDFPDVQLLEEHLSADPYGDHPFIIQAVKPR